MLEIWIGVFIILAVLCLFTGLLTELVDHAEWSVTLLSIATLLFIGWLFLGAIFIGWHFISEGLAQLDF